MGPCRKQATDSHCSFEIIIPVNGSKTLRSAIHLEMCWKLSNLFLGWGVGGVGVGELIDSKFAYNTKGFSKLLRPIYGIPTYIHIGPLAPLLGHHHFPLC